LLLLLDSTGITEAVGAFVVSSASSPITCNGGDRAAGRATDFRTAVALPDLRNGSDALLPDFECRDFDGVSRLDFGARPRPVTVAFCDVASGLATAVVPSLAPGVAAVAVTGALVSEGERGGGKLVSSSAGATDMPCQAPRRGPWKSWCRKNGDTFAWGVAPLDDLVLVARPPPGAKSCTPNLRSICTRVYVRVQEIMCIL